MDTGFSDSDDSLDDTFGVLFLGFIIAVALYGWTFFQTYVFFTRYPNEHTPTKWMVGWLWTLDTLATGCLSQMMYHYLITDFLTPFDELHVTESFILEKIFSALIVSTIHLYYAVRTWHLNGRRAFIAETMALVSMISLVLGVFAITSSSKSDFFVDLVTHKFMLLMALSEAASTICDFAIVATQYYLLQPHRKPGMKTVTGWYEKIILHTLNRGTLFTLLQVAVLISFLAFPRQYFWIFFHFTASKVYVNSLLAMLTSRHTFRGRGVNEEESLNTRSRAISRIQFNLGTSMDQVSEHDGVASSLDHPLDSTDEGKSVPSMTIELGKVSPSSTLGVIREKPPEELIMEVPRE